MPDPTFLLIEKTGTETPTGSMNVMSLTSFDQTLTNQRPVRSEETDAVGPMIEKTGTETPTGSMAIYIETELDQSLNMGEAWGDAFGNVWCDQKRKGGVS